METGLGLSLNNLHYGLGFRVYGLPSPEGIANKFRLELLQPNSLKGEARFVCFAYRASQRLQYPLIKEYTLYHIRDPTII